jgi:sterol desaturase/sphingolipid hydroxylase (fatty acid hydroxylase superfamily)
MEILKSLVELNINYIVVALIVLFYSLEQLFEPQFAIENKTLHWGNNFLFQLIFFVVNIYWAYVIVFCIEWLNAKHIGLLYLVDMPYWLKLIIGVAMFDFVTYWFHRLGHVVPFLWRFHRVHHSDTRLDASSNFRSHPIEIYLWFGTSNILAAGIFGLDLFTYGVYFLIITPLFFLEHTNLRFPAWLDKTVGLVFTTPNIHKIHHDQDQHYTDSNFADIFILWDRIFGTFTYKPVEQVKLGLEEFDTKERQGFWFLLRSPFLHIKRVEHKQ